RLPRPGGVPVRHRDAEGIHRPGRAGAGRAGHERVRVPRQAHGRRAPAGVGQRRSPKRKRGMRFALAYASGSDRDLRTREKGRGPFTRRETMTRRTWGLLVAALLLAPVAGFADEGMWLFNHAPKKYLKEKYHF